MNKRAPKPRQIFRRKERLVAYLKRLQARVAHDLREALGPNEIAVADLQIIDTTKLHVQRQPRLTLPTPRGAIARKGGNRNLTEADWKKIKAVGWGELGDQREIVMSVLQLRDNEFALVDLEPDSHAYYRLIASINGKLRRLNLPYRIGCTEPNKLKVLDKKRRYSMYKLPV